MCAIDRSSAARGEASRGMLGMVNTLVHKVGLIPDSAVYLAQDLGTPGLETEAVLFIAGEANTLELEVSTTSRPQGKFIV